MRIALTSSLFLLATQALAAPAPNLSASGAPPPTTTVVYTPGTLAVANVGNRDASGVVLTIRLIHHNRGVRSLLALLIVAAPAADEVILRNDGVGATQTVNLGVQWPGSSSVDPRRAGARCGAG